LINILTELDRNFDTNIERVVSGPNVGINLEWLHVKHTAQCGISVPTQRHIEP
jgi:hypothetical protein